MALDDNGDVKDDGIYDLAAFREHQEALKSPQKFWRSGQTFSVTPKDSHAEATEEEAPKSDPLQKRPKYLWEDSTSATSTSENPLPEAPSPIVRQVVPMAEYELHRRRRSITSVLNPEDFDMGISCEMDNYRPKHTLAMPLAETTSTSTSTKALTTPQTPTSTTTSTEQLGTAVIRVIEGQVTSLKGLIKGEIARVKRELPGWDDFITHTFHDKHD